ncbi:MAG: hypothetical protein KGQ58_01360 [Proteobacteria bacterium]|nr:hypothetical protein [Pseudomonadota bacterium]MDE3208177.1 hypothetical protein [Pseudomonadota bacterium]
MKKIGYLLVLLLLSGCGFRLQKTADLGGERVYVDAPPRLQQAVAQELRIDTTAQVVGNPSIAQAILEIHATSEQRILSLNSSGRVAEYGLFYQPTFRMYDPHTGKVIINQQTLVFHRDFIYNDAAVLATANNIDLLYADMRKSAAQMIVYRIGVLFPRVK